MESQRREETEHSSGNETRGFGKAVMLGQNGARKTVNTPRDAFHESSFGEPFQFAARDASTLEIPGANEAFPTKERLDSLSVCPRHTKPRYFYTKTEDL
jgi:hypothetical protein